MMKLLPLFFLVFLFSGCLVKDTMKEMKKSVKNEDGSVNTIEDIGKSDEVSKEQAPYKKKIEYFLSQFKMIGKHDDNVHVSYYASDARLNTHGLQTGARAELFAKMQIQNRFCQIACYRSGQEGKAEEFYIKLSNGEKGRYFKKGQWILYFTKAGGQNDKIVEVFNSKF